MKKICYEAKHAVFFLLVIEYQVFKVLLNIFGVVFVQVYSCIETTGKISFYFWSDHPIHKTGVSVTLSGNLSENLLIHSVTMSNWILGTLIFTLSFPDFQILWSAKGINIQSFWKASYWTKLFRKLTVQSAFLYFEQNMCYHL